MDGKTTSTNGDFDENFAFAWRGNRTSSQDYGFPNFLHHKSVHSRCIYSLRHLQGRCRFVYGGELGFLQANQNQHDGRIDTTQKTKFTRPPTLRKRNSNHQVGFHDCSKQIDWLEVRQDNIHA